MPGLGGSAKLQRRPAGAAARPKSAQHDMQLALQAWTSSANTASTVPAIVRAASCQTRCCLPSLQAARNPATPAPTSPAPCRACRAAGPTWHPPSLPRWAPARARRARRCRAQCSPPAARSPCLRCRWPAACPCPPGSPSPPLHAWRQHQRGSGFMVAVSAAGLCCQGTHALHASGAQSLVLHSAAGWSTVDRMRTAALEGRELLRLSSQCTCMPCRRSPCILHSAADSLGLCTQRREGAHRCP